MSWSAEIRRTEAAYRRQEREERKRQREIKHLLKEQAKLSALEQARLEVERYENALDVLLSVHKESSSPIDWHGYACALPPHIPPRLVRHELAIELQQMLLHGAQIEGELSKEQNSARLLDEQEHCTAVKEYEHALTNWDSLRSLACRVLSGEADAYYEAISAFSAFDEISNLGSSIDMRAYDSRIFKCVLKVSGHDILPTEVKTLTASGKVTTKGMPRARFNEIYQDYVCGCILRVAREVLALLPVQTVLVTATVDGIDSRTGQPIDMPVVSAAIPRTVAATLDFSRVDPSDALENFVHRGKVERARRSGEFVQIEPLTPDDLKETEPEKMNFAMLVAQIQDLHREMAPPTAMPAPDSFEELEPSALSL